MIDFGESYLIYRVEVDVIDWCGTGCTQVFLYDGGTIVDSDSNQIVAGEETLIVDLGPGGAMVDAIGISSCEGEILGTSVRIYSETVADDAQTWSGVKKIYR